MTFDFLNLLEGLLVSILSIAGTSIFMRSKYKAEVAEAHANALKAKNEAEGARLENDDRMSIMYRRMYTDLVQDLKKEREELKRKIEELELKLTDGNSTLIKAFSRMERAIKSIKNCPYNYDCPALGELQNAQGDTKVPIFRKPRSNRQREPGTENRDNADRDPPGEDEDDAQYPGP